MEKSPRRLRRNSPLNLNPTPEKGHDSGSIHGSEENADSKYSSLHSSDSASSHGDHSSEGKHTHSLRIRTNSSSSVQLSESPSSLKDDGSRDSDSEDESLRNTTFIYIPRPDYDQPVRNSKTRRIPKISGAEEFNEVEDEPTSIVERDKSHSEGTREEGPKPTNTRGSPVPEHDIPEEPPTFHYTTGKKTQKKLNYLNAVGIPLLPPPDLFDGVEDPELKAETAINSAFMRHMTNHRKYDTLHSYRSCDHCAICKSLFRGEIPEEVKRRVLRPELSRTSSSTSYDTLKDEVLTALDNLEDYVNDKSEIESAAQQEPINIAARSNAPRIPKQRVQVISSRHSQQPSDFQVKQGEILEVIEQRGLWLKCKGSIGQESAVRLVPGSNLAVKKVGSRG
ncbi:hypothetical protein AB6A40_003002 [Gnathostoma spinigerum]|uniref:SH3 domain-containing protein n=1 Tax=Gnathostoma spinigerum TaxID=75299 RepID=A0ABD6E8D2_9BILA